MDTVLYSRPALLKKGANNINGGLKITHHHLLWAPGTAGAAQEVKLAITNISAQQKATKAGQFFIRIVPKNGSPIIFSFENEVDRNTAVEITAPMLSGQSPAPPGGSAPPASTTGSGKTAAQGQSPAAGPDVALKEKLLSEDRDLKALYDQLMHSGALTDTEFWASHNRQSLLNRAKGKERPAQKTGLSTSMVTDVRTDSDGRSSKAMFRITDNMIPQIFAERPEVHHCYLANVPHNFSDQEFWNKFGNYEWTRRKKQLQKKDKTITLTVEDQELLEMFDRFRRSEQLKKEAQMKARQALPSVNLAADGYDTLSSSAGGFGLAFDGAKEGGVGLSRTSVGTDIIRDLNRHAAVVLEGVGTEASEDHGQVAAALAKLEQSKAKANERVDWDAANHNRWRDAAGREAQVLPELRAEATAANEPLRIGDPRKYFDAASADAAPSDAPGAIKSEKPSCGRGCDLQGMNPRTLPCPPIKSSLASQVLTEVGLRVKAAMAEKEDGFMIGDPKDALLPVLQQELRKQALVVNELLRHFWSVFPISSAPRAQKLEKMKDSLSKQYDQLLAMQEAAIGSDRVYISQVLRPCMQALDAAFTKYDAEQNLRANKRQRMART